MSRFVKNLSDEKERLIIIHLSDTHVNWNKFQQMRLDVILHHLFFYYSSYENATIVVLHTGDCVVKANNANFIIHAKIFNDFYIAMKESLGTRFYLFFCIGNHDLGNGFCITKNCYSIIKEHLSPICDNDKDFFEEAEDGGIFRKDQRVDIGDNQFHFLLLNSMEQQIKDGKNYTAGGNLGRAQQNWIRDTLEMCKKNGENAIIALHHHPFKDKTILKDVFFNRPIHCLKDAPEFTRIVKDYQNEIVGVFFGHRHWREDVQIDEEDDNKMKDFEESKPLLHASGSTTEGSHWLLSCKKVVDVFSVVGNNSKMERETWNLYIWNLWKRKYTALLYNAKGKLLYKIKRTGGYHSSSKQTILKRREKK